MANTQPKSTLDGLPKQFVASLRVLFDILDEEKQGYIRLTEIESRWKDDGVRELPKGVVEALRKVTPPNGLLSFERFVAGLKIALLRSQSGQKNGNIEHKNQDTENSQTRTVQNTSQGQNLSNQRGASERTATVRPNNVMLQQSRTLSMPHLITDNPKGNQTDHDENNPSAVPPPYPGDQGQWVWNQTRNSDKNEHGREKNGMMNVLKNWQLDRMGGRDRRFASTSVMPERTFHNASQGPVSKEAPASLRGVNEDPAIYKKSSPKKKEPRRHTLANGIDYNMLKRMKQLEQEKDILLQGLEAVDRARDWYHRQIAALQEKQKVIGKTTAHADYSVEANQERMNFQMARIFEVNQQLKALTESSEKGFPLHMNLAVREPSKPPPAELDNATQMIKAQNKLLTQEVSQKGDRITQLEREKASLIRELFDARSKNKTNNYDDTTFM